jgi:hypothetical protein
MVKCEKRIKELKEIITGKRAVSPIMAEFMLLALTLVAFAVLVAVVAFIMRQSTQVIENRMGLIQELIENMAAGV